MPLTRDQIVAGLQRIVGPDDVITDAAVLQQSSVDNFRKLENIFNVHTRPLPAAVAMVRNVLCLRMMSSLPILTVRLLPSVRNTTRMGT